MCLIDNIYDIYICILHKCILYNILYISCDLYAIRGTSVGSSPPAMSSGEQEPTWFSSSFRKSASRIRRSWGSMSLGVGCRNFSSSDSRI